MKCPFLTVLTAVVALPLAVCAASLEKDVQYGVAQGERLLLDVSLPDGTGPFPAVILVHGGAWRRGDKNGGQSPDKPGKGFMAPMHEPLTQAGFAWFSINYRLAPKYPYPACIEDVETAIRWVKANAQKYNIDPARIAISGESAGGHLVALAAVRADESTRVAAVVPFYPATDFTVWLTPGKSMGDLAEIFGPKTYDEQAQKLVRSASPIYAVKPGLAPFLFVHGDADTRVAYSQSTSMKKALEDAGVPCKLITVPGENHGMANWDKKHPGYKAEVIDWLKETLKIGR